jgi:ATP synthase protein I
MNMESSNKKDENSFSKEVEEKAQRKLNAIHNDKRSVWFGIGMFGMVGWSVAVPTILGAVLGMWMDKKYPESFSWTLSFLILGLISGCLIAWHWITKEHNEMNQEKDE